jgi:predicted trehalose synthase
VEQRAKTTAMVLTGCVAVASAAYAVGSQTGGGTSGAATRSGDRAGARGQTLAQRLGVSEAKLRAAFDDIRDDATPPKDPRARIVEALADALDLPQQKVSDALDDLRKQHEAEQADRRAALAKSLADELGIDASKVTAALEKLRPDHRGARRFRGGPPPGGPVFGGPPPGGPGFDGPPPGGPRFEGRVRGRMRLAPPRRDAFLAALAKELGVEKADLRAALEKVRPKPPKTDPRAGFVADLAKALGVDEADVKSALDGLRKQAEADMKARRDKLAAELAERLDLPLEKVKDALAAGPPGPWAGPPGGPHARMAPPPPGGAAPPGDAPPPGGAAPPGAP